MSSENRAHKVCEQMLCILKSSKLNYLVKETPYSAFITIRKRFLKDISCVTLASEDDSPSEADLRRENMILKEKCKELEVEVGYLNIDKENMELANEALQKENKTLRIEVEKLEADLTSSNKKCVDQKEEVDKVNEESSDLELKHDFIKSQLANLKVKLAEMEKAMREKLDDNEVLENIIKNKDTIIDQFRANMDSSDLNPNIESSHSCKQCDFTAESEKGLKIHMARKHAVKCDKCDETFHGALKLSTHMCRIQVENPAHKHFYTKNWFIENSCIRIFSKNIEREVALMHSEHCKSNPCSELPRSLEYSLRVDDENGVTHIDANCFLKSGKISWDVLESFLD